MDFARPAHGWTDESLASALRVPRSTLEPIIAGLMADGLLTKGGEHRLIPGRDPHRITLSDIVAAVRGNDAESHAPDAWNQAIDAIADRIETAIASELGPRTVGDLVDEFLEDQST
jgi:DNA-binding IscR family transcriptional regulator